MLSVDWVWLSSFRKYVLVPDILAIELNIVSKNMAFDFWWQHEQMYSYYKYYYTHLTAICPGLHWSKR